MNVSDLSMSNNTRNKIKILREVLGIPMSEAKNLVHSIKLIEEYEKAEKEALRNTFLNSSFDNWKRDHETKVNSATDEIIKRYKK